jgi:hypothetical protein
MMRGKDSCSSHDFGGIAMKRLAIVVALGALLGMVGGLMTAGPALARGPQWELVPAEPFTLPADFCGFPIGFSWPVQNEYSKILKAADGSMIVLITGVDKIAATNLSTGKTITSNVSGPAKVTTFPDGSVTAIATGVSGIVFSPADAERFGMPAVGVTAGEQTFSFDADGNLVSFSLQGHVVLDTCAALS